MEHVYWKYIKFVEMTTATVLYIGIGLNIMENLDFKFIF